MPIIWLCMTKYWPSSLDRRLGGSVMSDDDGYIDKEGILDTCCGQGLYILFLWLFEYARSTAGLATTTRRLLIKSRAGNGIDGPL